MKKIDFSIPGKINGNINSNHDKMSKFIPQNSLI